jgi:hypothetical protein
MNSNDRNVSAYSRREIKIQYIFKCRDNKDRRLVVRRLKCTRLYLPTGLLKNLKIYYHLQFMVIFILWKFDGLLLQTLLTDCLTDCFDRLTSFLLLPSSYSFTQTMSWSSLKFTVMPVF